MSNIEQMIAYAAQLDLAMENDVFSDLGMRVEQIDENKNEYEYTLDSINESIQEVKDIKTSLRFLLQGDFPLVVESYIEQTESIIEWYESAFE
jgi:formiminotetrahydrofolate cyclodeaminase